MPLAARVLILLQCCCALFAQADTANLTRLLRSVRRPDVRPLTTRQASSIRSALDAWIDRRFREGRNEDSMNAELRAAGLVAAESQELTVGYLLPLTIRPVAGQPDLSLVTASVGVGINCYWNQTGAIFDRTSGQRLLTIASGADHLPGYFLANTALARRRDTFRVASAWVISNCTSDWNGTMLRVDEFNHGIGRNLLSSAPGFRNSGGAAIQIEWDRVFFQYARPSGDDDFTDYKAVAAYQFQGGHAIRTQPLASSYGGFIREWLAMTDQESIRWSTPEAASAHSRAVREAAMPYHWERVASCPGNPPVRELAVRGDKSTDLTVFRIREGPAEQMKMLSVSDRVTTGCREIDIRDTRVPMLSEPGLKPPH